MLRSRSAVAFLTNLLLVHVMWIGTGSACVMPSMVESHGSMAGMNMSTGAEMPGMDLTTSAGADAAQTPDQQHAPCRFPWAPTGCESMTPCAPVAIGSTQQVLRETIEPGADVATLRVLMPPSRGHAPEPPPPRA